MTINNCPGAHLSCNDLLQRNDLEDEWWRCRSARQGVIPKMGILRGFDTFRGVGADFGTMVLRRPVRDD